MDELIAEGLFPPDMDRDEIVKQQRRALYVTLDGAATVKSAVSDILLEFKDPRATLGTATSLLGRVYDYMRRCGTQILFLDEIQHLDDRQTEKDKKPKRAAMYESTAVTDTLKTMLIRGLVPIVFIGVDDAESMILGDPQLSARCVSKIEFESLRDDVPEERDIFLDYCGMLGIKLHQHGLFDEASNLIEGDLPAVIHRVASGRLGMASNLIAAACSIAREQRAPRVLREHVSGAIDEWAIPMGHIDYNPLAQGLRDYERRAA
ncbi:ATP-binding protein [Mesorhizobium sp. CO1-1-9]|nr:ATP-binding protein [Mesorhizobium sp. CO1-1-9]